MNEKQFFERIFRLVNLYNAKTKQPRTFSTGHTLHSAETHAIEIIGSSEGVTSTQLAKSLSVTKGAVSQTTSKLISKELACKRLSEDGSTILLYLKPDGVTIYNEHRRLHEKMLSEISGLTAQIPSETKELLLKIADTIESELELL